MRRLIAIALLTCTVFFAAGCGGDSTPSADDIQKAILNDSDLRVSPDLARCTAARIAVANVDKSIKRDLVNGGGIKMTTRAVYESALRACGG
jgi:hypothetical protein